MSNIQFVNQLLIAMPTLNDPEISGSVTVICEHSSDGALGIALNKIERSVRLGDILEQMNMVPDSQTIASQPVLRGGSSNLDRASILHRPYGQWERSRRICDSLEITTSKDILAAIVNGSGPPDSQIVRGYTRWEAGELEQGLREKAWILVPFDTLNLFEIPIQDRWAYALKSIGVNPASISHLSGSA